MIFEPRPYQQRIIEHIATHPRVNVWADPGLGKSSATLTALDILWMSGSRFHPALVIAPLRVARGVWSAEIQKWDHLHGMTVSRIVGNAKQREAALRAKADVYTINYENLVWLVDKLGSDWPFRVVVSDESTRLKNFRLRHGGKRAQALAKVTKMTGRWVNLTGTPAPNGLIDLWGQQWFVDGGERLGKTFTAFKERWFCENAYTREISPWPHAETEISGLLSDVTISLRAADHFDLPDAIHNAIEVELPPAAQAQYDAMEEQMFLELQGKEIEAVNAAAKSIKCLQIASGFAFTDKEGAWEPLHTMKLDALRGLLDELSGKPLVVAYHFKPDLARILKAFPQARELRTQQDEDDWNAGKIPMLVLHPASAGHGLNLQYGGHHMCFYSTWWDLELNDQVMERIGPVRQAQAGLHRPVFYHRIVAAGTVDETVAERLVTKRSVQDALRERAQRR
jgi:SNF2 family DNA or RNA helicase